MNCLTFNILSLFSNVATAQVGSKTRLRDEIAHHKLALHSEFMALYGLDPLVQIQRISDLSIHSRLAFLTPQMIHLLDRNRIISDPVNKSEIHPALSKLDTFNSLSIYAP